jgi:HD superfamily phosphodiesterase
MPDPGDHDPVWRAALPYLRARKNDIHVPMAYDYALRLLESHPEADREVVLLTILLHDVGWAVLDQERIISEGFGPGMMESEIRIAHEREGARLAREILGGLGYDAELIARVAEIVDGHDTRPHAISREDELVKDADVLWRFSIAGTALSCDWFGDTAPRYLDRVEDQIEGRLFTEAARAIARPELAETLRVLRADVLREEG